MIGWNRIGVVLVLVYMVVAATFLAVTGYLTPTIDPSPTTVVKLSKNTPHLNDSVFWKISKNFTKEVDHPDIAHIKHVKACRRMYQGQLSPDALREKPLSQETIDLVSKQLQCGSDTQLVHSISLVWHRVFIAFMVIPGLFIIFWLSFVRAIGWIVSGFKSQH